MSDDPLAQGFQRMLDGLAQAGKTIEAQLAGAPAEVRADAYHALMRVLTANLGKAEADGRFPFPVHVNPPNQKWFLDNPDGITLHCALDDTQRYRLRGNLGGACYTSISTYEGKGEGLATKTTAFRVDRDLPVGPDGSIELLLSPEASDDPSHLRIAPGTGQLWIRQLFEDIDHEAPGWFQIENLGPTEPPPAVSVEAVASSMKRLGRALPMLTQLIFGAYRMQTTAHPVNRIRVWTEMQNGAVFTSSDVEYFIGAFALEPGERLVIRGTKRPCRHWNVVLYSRVLNSLEHRYRSTSLTGTRLVTDDAGGYELVVAERRPPGAAHWLDTEGRAEGVIVFRITGAEDPSEPPVATLERNGDA